MDPLRKLAVTMIVNPTSQVEAVIVSICLIILLLETPIKHAELTFLNIFATAIPMLVTVWSILWTLSMQRVIVPERAQLDHAKEADGKKSTTRTATQGLWELSSAAILQENGWRLRIAFIKSKILYRTKDWLILIKGYEVAQPGRSVNIYDRRVSAMQSDDNDSILARIAAGEDGSFELLIEKYGNLVWSIGKKFLYRQSDVEDAVQEVFISIWKSADKFDPSKAKEITFISMIARRRFIDHLRKISKHKNLESIDEDNSRHKLYKESILNESTDLQLIKNAIKNLDIDDQELLNLSIYQGYSHSEISKLLNLPLGTVKTKIRRNLLKLKEVFDTNETNTILNLNNA